jgi:peptidoglycan/LPS O-acetylase OafA/YrhL
MHVSTFPMLSPSTYSSETSGVVAAAAAHGSSELSRVDYIDGWRGLAIALVLLSHFGPKLPMDVGRFGVDVFFCLSGFLMSNILFAKRVPLIIFYKRRISRILPVFLLFVALVYAIAWIVTGRARLLEFLYTLTFLRTYLPTTPDIWHTGLPIDHLWSLNAEEHSYLLLSSITLLTIARGREWTVLISIGLLSILAAIAYVHFPLMAPPSGELGTEVVAAPLFLSAGYFLLRQHTRPFVASWMPMAALFAAAVSYTSLWPWWLHTVATPILLAFTVNHLSETPAAFRKLLALPAVRLLGIWSYSVYIWQQPFYFFRDHIAPLLGLILAVAAGVCSFYLFENPIRTLLNRRW